MGISNRRRRRGPPSLRRLPHHRERGRDAARQPSRAAPASSNSTTKEGTTMFPTDSLAVHDATAANLGSFDRVAGPQRERTTPTPTLAGLVPGQKHPLP